MRVCKKCKRSRNRNAFLGQKQTCTECLKAQIKIKKPRKSRKAPTYSQERIEKNRRELADWLEKNPIKYHTYIFDILCEEPEKKMVLNDTVICDRCGCEVWYEDAHRTWETEEVGYGWITRFNKTYFKVNSFGQEHDLPSRNRRRGNICSFCVYQKRANEGTHSLYKRDLEKKHILRALGIDNLVHKMNESEVREIINIKRIELQIKRELKKIKQ